MFVCANCGEEKEEDCPPCKTSWHDLSKKPWLVDIREFCSDKCLRESLKSERANRLRSRAVAAAAGMQRYGLDSSTAEIVWRMIAPKFYVHVCTRQGNYPIYAKTTEYF